MKIRLQFTIHMDVLKALLETGAEMRDEQKKFFTSKKAAKGAKGKAATPLYTESREALKKAKELEQKFDLLLSPYIIPE